MLISIQLFMQGDGLQPQVLTDQIGISPASAYAMGDQWVTGQGVVKARSIGLWKWGISEDRDDTDMNVIAKRFCQSLQHLAGKFTTMPGVECAWVDIFVCKEMTECTSTDVALNLDCESLQALCALALPIEITTSLVDAEK